MIEITMEKLFAFDIMKETEQKLKTATDLTDEEKMKLSQKLCFCQQVVTGRVQVPLETLEELLL